MADLESHNTPSIEFISRVTRAQRPLYAFLLTLLRQPADAEDVLQETNIVLLKKAGQFDDRLDFIPWAMQFAKFQALAFLKRQKRVPLAFDESLLIVLADEAIAEEAEIDPRRQALNRCIQKLSEQQRKWIRQRYETGGSVNAMAQQTGRTPKAMSELLRRIRRALLICIEDTMARESTA